MTIAHSASVNKWRRASARLRDMRPKRPDRRRPERPRHRGCQAAVLRRPADTHSRGNRLFRHLPSINYGIIASRRQMGSGVKQSPDFHDTWIASPLTGGRVVSLVPPAGRIQQEHVRPRRVAHGVRRGACCRVSPLWRRFHTAGVSRPTNGQESIPRKFHPQIAAIRVASCACPWLSVSCRRRRFRRDAERDDRSKLVPICNLDKTVVHHVRRWTAEGRWVDLGQWVEGDRRGDVFYEPTPEEIAAKCALLRTRSKRLGPYVRHPRDGKYAVATTAGI